MAPPDYAADLWSVFLPAIKIIVPPAALCIAAVFTYLGARFMNAKIGLTNSLRANDAAKDIVVRIDREYVAPRKDPATPEVFDEAAKVTARQMGVDAMRERVPALSPAEAADKVDRTVAELQATGVISAPLAGESTKTPSVAPPAVVVVVKNETPADVAVVETPAPEPGENGNTP